MNQIRPLKAILHIQDYQRLVLKSDNRWIVKDTSLADGSWLFNIISFPPWIMLEQSSGQLLGDSLVLIASPKCRQVSNRQKVRESYGLEQLDNQQVEAE